MRVDIANLSQRFGPIVALRDVCLTLESGSHTALIGPNGSGKSTLVRRLMGMLEGLGSVRIDGLDAGDDRAALAPRMAYMPQIAPRFAAPVRDVVQAIASVRNIDELRIRDVAKHLFLDLDGIWKRPFRALSGGQRQKVLAALCLSARAELLLLDEPTASMDPLSRSAFFDLVGTLDRGVTIVLSSHRLEEIRRLVHGVVALNEGAVVWNGAADDYLAENATALIEVLAAPAGQTWLLEHGYTARTSGWWIKAVRAGERVHEMRRVVTCLNGQLLDMTASDVERLHPGGTPS